MRAWQDSTQQSGLLSLEMKLTSEQKRITLSVREAAGTTLEIRRFRIAGWVGAVPGHPGELGRPDHDDNREALKGQPSLAGPQLCLPDDHLP